MDFHKPVRKLSKTIQLFGTTLTTRPTSPTGWCTITTVTASTTVHLIGIQENCKLIVNGMKTTAKPTPIVRPVSWSFLI